MHGSSGFKAMSLEQQQQQHALLLTRVKELDMKSAKAARTLIELRKDLQDARDKTEHVKKDTSKLLETYNEQFTCQLESVNRSVEDVKNRVENQMLMQEAVNSGASQLLRLKSDRRLSRGSVGSSRKHVDGIADTSGNEGTHEFVEPQHAMDVHGTTRSRSKDEEQCECTEALANREVYDVDTWCLDLYRKDTTNIGAPVLYM